MTAQPLNLLSLGGSGKLMPWARVAQVLYSISSEILPTWLWAQGRGCISESVCGMKDMAC